MAKPYRGSLVESLSSVMFRAIIPQSLHSQAGTRPPPDSTLRNWRRALESLSPEAFKAIGEVTQLDDPTIDSKAISKDLILGTKFKELKAQPVQQALIVQMVAR